MLYPSYEKLMKFVMLQVRRKKVWAYLILLHVLTTSHLRDDTNVFKKRCFQSSTVILYDTLPLCCQDRDTNIPERRFQDLPQKYKLEFEKHSILLLEVTLIDSNYPYIMHISHKIFAVRNNHLKTLQNQIYWEKTMWKLHELHAMLCFSGINYSFYNNKTIQSEDY